MRATAAARCLAGAAAGDPEHVRALLGDRVTDVRATTQSLRVSHFATPEAFRDYFKINYGPTIAVYRSLADQLERQAELDDALADLGRRFDRGIGETIMEWEYLLLTAEVKA